MPAQVYVVFGAPGSGVSSILRVLGQATRTRLLILPWQSPLDLEAIEEAQHNTTGRILVDVDAGLLLASDVEALIDARVLYERSGALIHVSALENRVLKWNKDRPEHVTPEDFYFSRLELHDIKKVASQHRVSFLQVQNNTLAEAVAALCVLTGIRS